MDTLSFHHQFWMQKALEEAEKAFRMNEVPVGAVIVCEGEIIAKGHNSVETLCDPTAHAEILSITAGCNYFHTKYLKECSVYVTVEPCPMCAGALKWAQVKEIIFGCEDPKGGYSMFSPLILHPKTNIVSGILEDSCRKLMKDFFKLKR